VRKQLVTIALAALSAIALAASSALVGEARRPPSIARAQAPRDAAVPPAPAPAEENYRCVQPVLEIPKTAPCDRGRGYPQCRWQMPSLRGPERLYSIWRNTTPEHRWGRPGLVSLILASAADYQQRWPGERLTVGDLDAPGPRHSTHDRGVDVDLYLTHAMMTRSEGGRRYVDNYAERSSSEVASLRARVLDLARILATCARGQVRIYYNDPEIVSSFRTWFDARGMRSEVGLPMVPHNELHEFHFHLTIPEDFAPLPIAE
jgi:hypothetical protein